MLLNDLQAGASALRLSRRGLRMTIIMLKVVAQLVFMPLSIDRFDSASQPPRLLISAKTEFTHRLHPRHSLVMITCDAVYNKFVKECTREGFS